VLVFLFPSLTADSNLFFAGLNAFDLRAFRMLTYPLVFAENLESQMRFSLNKKKGLRVRIFLTISAPHQQQAPIV
jgi:hypothetical protein